MTLVTIQKSTALGLTEEITRLRARIAELEAAQAWRPIETAREWLANDPDGIEILVLCIPGGGENFGGDIDIVHWERNHWRDRDGERRYPSKWMPLTALKGGE